MVVGSRVEVEGHGPGMLSVDNEDGTWNVDLDDGTEGDFRDSQLSLCSDQSLDAVLLPPEIVMESGVRHVRRPELEPKPEGWTRFVCFSDTHGKHASIPARSCPEADVLLHAGDFSNTGELEAVESFSAWLDDYPAEHKVVVAGNHDITFHEAYYRDRGAARFHRAAVVDPESGAVELEVAPYDCSRVRGALGRHVYLEDGAADVAGYTVYGSPWQPEFCDWAFMLPRGQPMREVWARVPPRVDVLLTHTPPHGHGDRTSENMRCGCEMLRAAIEERAVSVNVFGHIHAGYGCSSDGTTLYVNASTCDSDYRPVNPPIVFDLPPPQELRAATQRLAERRREKQRPYMSRGEPPGAALRMV